MATLFTRFLTREIEDLPWSESPVSAEADLILDDLVDLNRRGLLTINSQPAINGVKSSHPVHGWGPPNGYVYQKAYLELLVAPDVWLEMKRRIHDHADLTYHAVTKSGSLETNAKTEEPNAVTWGVFPGKEIVQPTIVEGISLLAWKDEAFSLGIDWAHCHDSGTPSRLLIQNIMDTWRLVNIGVSSPASEKKYTPHALIIYIRAVNNDFQQPRTIFTVLKDLQVPSLDAEPEAGLTFAQPASEATRQVNGSNGHA